MTAGIRFPGPELKCVEPPSIGKGTYLVEEDRFVEEAVEETEVSAEGDPFFRAEV